MPDALTTITKLIESPPGQLVAGGVLAGIVWKFFERVENVLTDETKLEIALWLVGVKVGQKLEPWPDTFVKVFDRVFGERHLSWKCFLRSSQASLLIGAVVMVLGFGQHVRMLAQPFICVSLMVAVPFVLILPDYLALLSTRLILKQMVRTTSSLSWANLLIVDALVTWYIALAAAQLAVPFFTLGNAFYFHTRDEFAMFWDTVLAIGASWSMRLIPVGNLTLSPTPNGVSGRISLNILFFLPALVSSTWLWLYAGSGFLLKAARRFDIGFDWFNRHFDIEEKPLQSIGLVAGALVALLYWAAVIVSRVIG